MEGRSPEVDLVTQQSTDSSPRSGFTMTPTWRIRVSSLPFLGLLFLLRRRATGGRSGLEDSSHARGPWLLQRMQIAASTTLISRKAAVLYASSDTCFRRDQRFECLGMIKSTK